MRVLAFLAYIFASLLANVCVFAGGVTDTSQSSVSKADQASYLAAISPEASDESFQSAKTLFDAKSSDLAYQIRIASLTAVNARHVMWPGTKIDFVNKSIEQFNELEPKISATNQPYLMYEFYTYRARTFMKLPDRFKKNDTPYNKLAYQDAKKALTIYENGNFSLTKEELGRLYSAYSISAFKNNRVEEAANMGEKAISNGNLPTEDLKEIKEITAKFNKQMDGV